MTETLATLPLGSRVVYRGTSYKLLTRDLFANNAYLCRPGGGPTLTVGKNEPATLEDNYA